MFSYSSTNQTSDKNQRIVSVNSWTYFSSLINLYNTWIILKIKLQVKLFFRK
jgi:hypothetical protein